jgi:hypothetical protein
LLLGGTIGEPYPSIRMLEINYQFTKRIFASCFVTGHVFDDNHNRIYAQQNICLQNENKPKQKQE